MVGITSFQENCSEAPARHDTRINQRQREWSSNGPSIANTSNNTVYQKDELWKSVSDKLAAFIPAIADAKEFMNLSDSLSPTSKDHQPRLLECEAFHPCASLEEQKLVMEMVKLEKRARGEMLAMSVISGKVFKVNSRVVREEKASGTESEDEVGILSHAEWNVLHQHSNHKDEYAKPPIGKLEEKLEGQSTLEFDKECRNVVELQRTYIDPVSGGTKSDLPSERSPNCRDHQEHGSTNLDDCSPISEREQDDVLEMFSVDDEAIATSSTNCNDEPIYSENHMKLVNMEIVQDDHLQRRKVMQALKLFNEEYELELKGKNTRGPHFEAAKHVKAKGMNITTKKPFGHIPGIKIGDEFTFRAELAIVGLNCQFNPGIDYVTLGGKPYATSVVNSGRYENEAKEDNILIYYGQGGNPNVSVSPADQKLTGGNLALMNSMEMGYPVRVIHKRRGLVSKTLGVKNKGDYTYVYDGLYKVNRFWHGRENVNCNLVYKFELQRLPGQPSSHDTSHDTDVEMGKQTQPTEVHDSFLGKENVEVVNGLQEQSRSHDTDVELRKQTQPMEVRDYFLGKENVELVDGLQEQSRSHGTEVCVLDDISRGKEKFKVRVVNEVDADQPRPFTYITNSVYPPHWYQRGEPSGCDCVDGCSDSVQCCCVVKNGGEIPFTEKGLIMRARTKSVVHECGPSCKCPPSCMNRVGQRGPHFRFEIFKTKSMGWGVRSRDYIMPGSFICEYIGELLEENEANRRIDNDEYLFDVCHGKSKNDDFALDAAKCGNLSRFMNHSCDPNVFSKRVLYENDDERAPHIMFFACRRIHPRTELRYDYNYSSIRIRDVNGKIKRKACSCGSRKCTGRLY